jgi:tRNA A37 threonylcarbamoyladenosine dehydratase
VAKESEVLGGVQATLTNANPAALLQHAALPDLNKEEIARYSRHLIMPEVGMAGQRKLKAASVLLIGASGLGSPLGLYLTAAGVGRIGLVDFDVVDYSNLQRQVIYGTKDVGRPKLQSAKDRLMVQPDGWVAKIAGLLPPNTTSRAARKYGSLTAFGLS